MNHSASLELESILEYIRRDQGAQSDIKEKFIAWRVNSTLNFTRKTDIATRAISVFRDSCDIGFSREI